MDINVSVNKICIANPDILNSGEAYIHKLKFNFSEEYTPDLVYRACFTCLSGTFVSPILNNECEIPPEALEADGTIELGVYAYILQDETLEKRFSPEHLFLAIKAGSYREGLESEAPTPTEQEQWLNAFNQNYLEKVAAAEDAIEQAKDEAIEEIEDASEGLVGRVNTLETDVANIKQEQNTQNTNISNNTTAINGINQSLRNYALKSEIPTDLSQLSNATTRFVNETQLSTAVNSEQSAREQADIGLQEQIDGITSSSDVKDIVGTYAELQNYDTSTLGNNDIIKVLQDNTHNDAMTYYRWDTATQQFIYIGQEGPYYTKSETDTKLADYVKNTDYATSAVGGVVKIGSTYKILKDANGYIYADKITFNDYNSASNFTFISKGTLENVITGKDLTTKAYVDGLVGDIGTILDNINGESVGA